MTRRTDGELRSAISSIEKMLLTTPSTDTIILRCLKQLMQLTGSHFGFAFECIDASGTHIPWQFSGSYILHNSMLVEKENSSTSNSIPENLQTRLLAGKCLTDVTKQYGYGPLPHNHPTIHNDFCIPLTDARRLHAVLFLCNAENGFDEHLETRLRPFLAASNCLLRASEKRYNLQSSSDSNSSSKGHTTSSNPAMLLGVLDTMFNSVIMLDETDTITMCNNAASAMLSISRSDIIGSPISRFLPKWAPSFSGRVNFDEEQSPSSNNKTIWRGVPALNVDGKKILVDLSAFELNNGDQLMRGLVMDDISERIRSTEDYHDTLKRFQVLTSVAPIGILQLNRDWECSYANDTWCEYCQMTPDEARGTGWFRGLHSSDADNVIASLRLETARSGKFEGEFRLQSPLGKVTWVKANACSLYSGSGETTGLIITFNDISKHLQSERKLREIAEKDQLTGLVNRTFFNDRLEQALKGTKRFGRIALMFIDLDEFKHINDTLGHEAGDALLKNVADRLQFTLREVDTIARIGGDEFTVLLSNVNSSNAITVIANKLISSLGQPFIINDRTIYVTCSIGIATTKEKIPSGAKQLLKQADIALYKAKTEGRNQYKFYTPELDQNANLHIHLRQSLKELNRKDFRVVYQPQVDAFSGKVIGLEALARWCHPEMDTIGPDIFVKMIEESGLINDFSNWLFEDVLTTMEHWNDVNGLPDDVNISINLSAKQFRYDDLAYNIQQRCQVHGISPRQIILEVTETALIDDPEAASKTLKKLKNMGFSIALDDFGTGYSSLLHLRKMPLKSVKIDRSFIKDVMLDNEDAKIVAAILILAESLELDVVAEGVDKPEIREWLLQHQCNVQQGYYFHKPLESIEIEQLFHMNSNSGAKIVQINNKLR